MIRSHVDGSGTAPRRRERRRRVARPGGARECPSTSTATTDLRVRARRASGSAAGTRSRACSRARCRSGSAPRRSTPRCRCPRSARRSPAARPGRTGPSASPTAKTRALASLTPSIAVSWSIVLPTSLPSERSTIEPPVMPASCEQLARPGRARRRCACRWRAGASSRAPSSIAAASFVSGRTTVDLVVERDEREPLARDCGAPRTRGRPPSRPRSACPSCCRRRRSAARRRRSRRRASSTLTSRTGLPFSVTCTCAAVSGWLLGSAERERHVREVRHGRLGDLRRRRRSRRPPPLVARAAAMRAAATSGERRSCSPRGHR